MWKLLLPILSVFLLAPDGDGPEIRYDEARYQEMQGMSMEQIMQQMITLEVEANSTLESGAWNLLNGTDGEVQFLKQFRRNIKQNIESLSQELGALDNLAYERLRQRLGFLPDELGQMTLEQVEDAIKKLDKLGMDAHNTKQANQNRFDYYLAVEKPAADLYWDLINYRNKMKIFTMQAASSEFEIKLVMLMPKEQQYPYMREQCNLMGWAQRRVGWVY